MSARDIADRVRSNGPEFVDYYIKKLDALVDSLLHRKLDMVAFCVLEIISELRSLPV